MFPFREFFRTGHLLIRLSKKGSSPAWFLGTEPTLTEVCSGRLLMAWWENPFARAQRISHFRLSDDVGCAEFPGVARRHNGIGSIAALRGPLLHPTNRQCDLEELFGHASQGPSVSHYQRSVRIKDFKVLLAFTDFRKYLHLQQAPAAVTAFIAARAIAFKGPCRPDEVTHLAGRELKMNS
jgi:hypothetical protein